MGRQLVTFLLITCVACGALTKIAAAQSHNFEAYWIDVEGEMIANLEETADCKGSWIRASVDPNGEFTITDGPNDALGTESNQP
jgi:hypothetical protein